jgi:hypothetical protein
MVPRVGIKGTFAFSAPYSASINSDQQLEVVSVRSLAELEASGEDPLTNIYKAIGELDTVFLADLKNNEPIIVFSTDGGDYIYVPANKLISDAKLSGISYSEKMVMVNLGYLPAKFNTTAIETAIKNAVNNAIGITPAVSVADTSAAIYVSAAKDTTLSAIRNNAMNVYKSDLTKYTELNTLYVAQQQLIANIEMIYAARGIGG